MPSRQERRKAERDAAKRAPGQAGAPTATGAKAIYAAALVDINVRINAGDWSTQIGDPDMLFESRGAEWVNQKAGDGRRGGDREARFSLGCRLVSEADETAGSELSAAERLQKLDVGFALCTAQFVERSPDRAGQ